MTVENLSSIWVANMDIPYWLVHSYSRWGGGKGLDRNIVILASCEYRFLRVPENLVQHPSNNIRGPLSWTDNCV